MPPIVPRPVRFLCPVRMTGPSHPAESARGLASSWHRNISDANGLSSAIERAANRKLEPSCLSGALRSGYRETGVRLAHYFLLADRIRPPFRGPGKTVFGQIY